MADAERCAEAVANRLSLHGESFNAEDVLVMSTGVIGQRIKMQNLLEHIPEVVRSCLPGKRSDVEFATAITTTGFCIW